ncbi:hypothetical protein [Xanthomonas sp. XNM01]|uniref:hypothetical protein n=1 Tax=Xanthomonas sp. XNM01 TaxID=2769289 RepID=UPI00177C4E3A|nr:hypothetical protein [Xanthomonas sp. XNM01]MBD9369373.1 hypothetical protein [Xanthomonas sp. XNM01]
MTTGPDPVDRHARTLHASALAHTSPEVLRRLRDARRAATATPARQGWLQRGGWLAGTACAAVLAVAVGLQLGDAPAPHPAPAPTATAAAVAGMADDADLTTSVVEPLQEDPGFYLWLASEAPALAME